MKAQETSMKRYITWILAGLMLTAFWHIASVGLAAEDTWAQKADMPTARADLSTSVVDGKIYAIGGGGAGVTVFPTVEEYDPLTDRWTKKADMPTARVYLSATYSKRFSTSEKRYKLP